MPLYEFQCEGCGALFEEIVPAGERPPCPECSRAEAKRLYSAPAIAGRRLERTGVDAKRSQAPRAERESARSERLADAKKQRERGESPAPGKRELPKGFWA